jgi:hypothetical protein
MGMGMAEKNGWITVIVKLIHKGDWKLHIRDLTKTVTVILYL